MTNLQISNSLTKSKDLFKPINPKKIGMYVCGPTVYANPHVGNGRSLVVFDLLFRVLVQLYGKENGCVMGKGGSMHLADLVAGFYPAVPIVGSTIPIGVGVALANKMKKNSNITCIFLGDGSTEEGVFHESLDFASLKNLNILFVCENNFYSVYSPMNVRQYEKRSALNLAKSHGLQGNHGDGSSVMEVIKKTKDGIKYIKKSAFFFLVELSK